MANLLREVKFESSSERNIKMVCNGNEYRIDIDPEMAADFRDALNHMILLVRRGIVGGASHEVTSRK